MFFMERFWSAFDRQSPTHQSMSNLNSVRNVQHQWSGWGEFFKIGEGGVEKVEPLFISKVSFVS